MTPNEQGRFCATCEKTVVDFTTMSDEALIAFFEEHKGQRICGRMRVKQLNRPLNGLNTATESTVLPLRRPIAGWRVVLASLALGAWLAGCMPTTAQAGTIIEREWVAVQAAEADDILPHKGLSGKVLDEQTKLPIAGATIELRVGDQVTTTTETNADGIFELDATAMSNIQGEALILVGHSDYEAGYYTLSPKTAKKKIEIYLNQYALEGEIWIEE